MAEQNLTDLDPIETQEWLESLQAVVEQSGSTRAHFLLQQLIGQARQSGINLPYRAVTAYANSVVAQDEPAYPGNDELEQRLLGYLRWNAMAIVVRGGKRSSELGGHIASYASAAMLYEVGFLHVFRGPNHPQAPGGDLLYVQGHCSPGIYARAFLEGRFSEKQLDKFRQEVEEGGLSSYPHPWLMPDFWQFPTVSMGLGPLQAIYQARFLKYLISRELVEPNDRKVWAFCGDGEMDEPESLGGLNIAAREYLDNLIFVVNCNLQRLDGPVRGNGKIIQELEGIFRGAGWNVIKVVWGRGWDSLLASEHSALLIQCMQETIDGEYQNYSAKGGAYLREKFFGKHAELTELVASWSDEELEQLEFGGHDLRKVYAAYQKAMTLNNGKPTVILPKTTKGYGMGAVGQGQNTTHQQKKLSADDLAGYKQRFNLPIADKDIIDAAYYCPDKDSEELVYMREQREKLGGYLPARRVKSSQSLTMPKLDAFQQVLKSSGDREISTTMAFVRTLNILMKDKNIKERIVPIIPDECRTFGMEGMFRQFGIYSADGQLYTPVDADQLMYFKEDKKGQLLNEGITEAGGFSSWLAAATSYSVSDFPMIPFFIYYSMFGFQRIGDFAWAAGDMRARGFLLGATAGRTTLAGEGLQHQDGHSHIISSTIPNCISYDPTYGYEIAVIIQDGLRRMYEEQEDVFYYLTVMNENYHHPEMPKGAEEGIIKGMYLLQPAKKAKLQVQLLGCGTILREVIEAAEILSKDYDVAADVWSVTSFTELAREGNMIERSNMRQAKPKDKQTCYVSECLDSQPGPVIAATDYMRSYADQIRPFVSSPYRVLGTDGFGRSDTRVNLRHFFEVDSKSIVLAALTSLAEQQQISYDIVNKAIKDLSIDVNKPDPTTV